MITWVLWVVSMAFYVVARVVYIGCFGWLMLFCVLSMVFYVLLLGDF